MRQESYRWGVVNAVHGDMARPKTKAARSIAYSARQDKYPGGANNEDRTVSALAGSIQIPVYEATGLMERLVPPSRDQPPIAGRSEDRPLDTATRVGRASQADSAAPPTAGAARRRAGKAVAYGGQDFSPAPAVRIIMQPVAGLKPRPPYAVYIASPARWAGRRGPG